MTERSEGVEANSEDEPDEVMNDFRLEPNSVIKLNGSKVVCIRESTHGLPAFLHNNGNLLITGIKALKDFRVVCEDKDVSSYYLTNRNSLKHSAMMDFIDRMEKDYTNKHLLKHVPTGYLDLLAKTENLFALDSRYGMAVGVRRLLEDFVVENYGVLLFFRENEYGNLHKKKDLDRLKKKHAGRIIALFSSKAQQDLARQHKTLDRTYVSAQQNAVVSNSKYQGSPISVSKFNALYKLYNVLSEFIHGRTSEPSQNVLKDGLELVMKSCMEYLQKGIGWGVR